MEVKYSEFLDENKILRKSQQRFKSEKHYISVIKVNKIALSNNDSKKMQTLDCKKKSSKKHLNKYITKENTKVDKPNWPQIPDQPYRILIICSSGPGKINALLNLINCEPAIVKIYLHAKYRYKTEYQLLISKHEETDPKYFKNPSFFLTFKPYKNFLSKYRWLQSK